MQTVLLRTRGRPLLKAAARGHHHYLACRLLPATACLFAWASACVYQKKNSPIWLSRFRRCRAGHSWIHFAACTCTLKSDAALRSTPRCLALRTLRWNVFRQSRLGGTGGSCRWPHRGIQPSGDAGANNAACRLVLHLEILVSIKTQTSSPRRTAGALRDAERCRRLWCGVLPRHICIRGMAGDMGGAASCCCEGGNAAPLRCISPVYLALPRGVLRATLPNSADGRRQDSATGSWRHVTPWEPGAGRTTQHADVEERRRLTSAQTAALRRAVRGAACSFRAAIFLSAGGREGASKAAFHGVVCLDRRTAGALRGRDFLSYGRISSDGTQRTYGRARDGGGTSYAVFTQLYRSTRTIS